MNTCEGMKLPALLFKFHNEELASFGSLDLYHMLYLVSILISTLIFGYLVLGFHIVIRHNNGCNNLQSLCCAVRTLHSFLD